MGGWSQPTVWWTAEWWWRSQISGAIPSYLQKKVCTSSTGTSPFLKFLPNLHRWWGRQHSDSFCSTSCQSMNALKWGGGMLFCLCERLCTMCTQRPEDGFRSPGPGVTAGYELPCGHWELKSGSLKNKMFLATSHLSSPSRNSLWVPQVSSSDDVLSVHLCLLRWVKSLRKELSDSGKLGREEP